MAEHQPDTERFDIQNPQPADLLVDAIIAPKANVEVQTAHGVLDFVQSAEEYHARLCIDFMDEQRGTVANAAGSVLIDLGRTVKYVEFTCPIDSAAAAFFVNVAGAVAGSGRGSLQVRAGETRSYYLPIRYIQISSGGGGTATYRITYGW